MNIKKRVYKKISASLFIVCFLLTNMTPSYVWAQPMLSLPQPGALVGLSSGFNPVILRGIEVDPVSPFVFHFIVDTGETKLSTEELQEEIQKIVRYFLAGLALPEDKLWVNLSPYEEDRIVDEVFGQTEMGRDLLAQDYILKQVTATLTHPEDKLGKLFWQRVYQKAYETFQTTNIPINTFNKVWIVPNKARVYVQDQKAIVIDSSLDILIDQDYLSMKNNLFHDRSMLAQESRAQAEKTSVLSSAVIKEIVLPELSKEINKGKNFAQLRQIYHSLILANWFKGHMREAFLNQAYSDQNSVEGIAIDDPKSTGKIYQQYLEAFKQGVCNFMRVEYDPYINKHIPRKYFSGGAFLNPQVIEDFSPLGQKQAGSVLSLPNVLRATISVFNPDRSRGGLFSRKISSGLKINTLENIVSAIGLSVIFGLSQSTSFASNQYFRDNLEEQIALNTIVANTLESESGDSESSGFFEKMNNVYPEASRIGNVYYGKIAYENQGQTARATLYADPQQTQEIGTLFRDQHQQVFIFEPTRQISFQKFGLSNKILIAPDAFDASMDNMLLSLKARQRLSRNISQLMNPAMRSQLSEDFPELLHLANALYAAGLTIDVQDIEGLASMVSNMRIDVDPKTMWDHEPNYFRLKLYQDNNGLLTDIGFNLDIHLRLSAEHRPVFQVRFTKQASDGSIFLFSDQEQRFSYQTYDLNLLNINKGLTFLDPTSDDNIMYMAGRVQDALPISVYDLSEYDNLNPVARKVVDRIARNLMRDMGQKVNSSDEMSFFPMSDEFLATINDPGITKIEVHGGKAIFRVQAPQNIYKDGKTIFLGDGSGTMRGDLLEIMIQVFDQVLSQRSESVFMGNVSNKGPGHIQSVSTKDFANQARELFLGQGATHLQENFLEASEMADQRGTIVYAGDFLPDSLSKGIDNWTKEDVDQRIFKPLVESLKKNEQRFMGYYIKNAEEDDAPLVELMESYAVEARNNDQEPLFYIIRHEDSQQDSLNVQKEDGSSTYEERVEYFSRMVNRVFSQSEKISDFNKLPIGDIRGLSDLNIVYMDREDHPVKIVDQYNRPVDFRPSVIPESANNEEVIVDFKTGEIRNYSIPAGAREVFVELYSGKKETKIIRNEPEVFLFFDGSASMKTMTPDGQYIDLIRQFVKDIPEDLAQNIVGIGSFGDRQVPDVEIMFGEKNPQKIANRYLQNLYPEGGTYLDQNLSQLCRMLLKEARKNKRPKRDDNDPNFKILQVLVFTDGDAAASRAEFSTSQLDQLYEAGIEISFVMIGNRSAWDPSQYRPRLRELYTRKQGFSEISASTNGFYYINPNNLSNFLRIYKENLAKGKQIAGKLPKLEFVKIIAKDSTGAVIDERVHKVKVVGNIGQLERSEEQLVFQFDGMDIFAWQTSLNNDVQSHGVENFSRAVYDAVVNKKELYVWMRNALDENGEVGPGLVQLSSDQLWKLVEKFYGGLSESDRLQDPAKRSNSSSSPAKTSQQSQKSMSLNSDNLGGIDFKADQFNILTQGEEKDFSNHIDIEAMMRDFDPHRVTPTVLNMVPVTSPQMILGPN